MTFWPSSLLASSLTIPREVDLLELWGQLRAPNYGPEEQIFVSVPC